MNLKELHVVVKFLVDDYITQSEIDEFVSDTLSYGFDLNHSLAPRGITRNIKKIEVVPK